MNLSKEFEKVVMKDRVQKTNDLDGLKQIALKLIDLHFGYIDTVDKMIDNGWLHDQS